MLKKSFVFVCMLKINLFLVWNHCTIHLSIFNKICSSKLIFDQNMFTFLIYSVRTYRTDFKNKSLFDRWNPRNPTGIRLIDVIKRLGSILDRFAGYIAPVDRNRIGRLPRWRGYSNARYKGADVPVFGCSREPVRVSAYDSPVKHFYLQSVGRFERLVLLTFLDVRAACDRVTHVCPS